MNGKTDWLDKWRNYLKIDIALLVLNSTFGGVNVARENWGWVTVFSGCAAFFATKLVYDTSTLITLSKAGINLANAVDEAVKKNE